MNITRGDIEERKPFLPEMTGAKVTTHDFYDVAFDSFHKVPFWTLHRVTPGRTAKKFHRDGTPIEIARSCGNFRNDPMIPESPYGWQYSLCGYDTGHLVPAEAMQFDKQALADSFFTSNACPQTDELNRGPWRTLEHNTFKAAMNGRELVVISGTIFTECKHYLPSGIAVPDDFFKVIVCPKEGIYDCWIMTNSEKPIVKFVTLSDIEYRTGLVFPFRNFWHVTDFMTAASSRGLRALNGIKIENLLNGEYTMLEDYLWNPHDAEYPDARIKIPKGFTTDFGSVPGIVQNVFLPIGTFRDPDFLGHDLLYGTEYFSWEGIAYKIIKEPSKNRAECDWRLLESLKADGDSWFSRNTIWSAVKVGGGFVWAKHNPESIEANRKLLK